MYSGTPGRIESTGGSDRGRRTRARPSITKTNWVESVVDCVIRLIRAA